MPRKGYDITGCAPGTPAAEAAARARQRVAPGSRTPRAVTPVNPSRHDGDEQETPRASRIGVSSENAPGNFPVYSQASAVQDHRGFQVQRRLPSQELYQNPLNISSIQAANNLMARPISGPHGHPVSSEVQSFGVSRAAPPASIGRGGAFVNDPEQFNMVAFRTPEFGAQQQHWDGSHSHASSANQHGIQNLPIAQPSPELFAYYQMAAENGQYPTANASAGTLAPQQTVDEDTEMTGISR
ncbi:hypothetical protein V8C35DRAFT_289421 [Trichoderma chlorosporum]